MGSSSSSGGGGGGGISAHHFERSLRTPQKQRHIIQDKSRGPIVSYF